MHHWDMAVGTPRAERYPVHVALRFRAVGDAEWREGWTENISRSGVLFQTQGTIDVATRVEIGLMLLPGSGSATSPQVTVFGDIVRAACSDEAHPILAARIKNYRFEGSQPRRDA